MLWPNHGDFESSKSSGYFRLSLCVCASYGVIIQWNASTHCSRPNSICPFPVKRTHLIITAVTGLFFPELFL